jgi:hypothetical protein
MCDLHGANKRLYRLRRRHPPRRDQPVGHRRPGRLDQKSALETVDRWTEGLRIEDWDLFLRLAARDALGFIDVSVCAYRLHGQSEQDAAT